MAVPEGSTERLRDATAKPFGAPYRHAFNPCDGTAPLHPRYFPPTSGFRFGFFTIPPGARRSVDPIGTASALEEIQQKLPGMIEFWKWIIRGWTLPTRLISMSSYRARWFWN